jgi:hypothetical protein
MVFNEFSGLILGSRLIIAPDRQLFRAAPIAFCKAQTQKDLTTTAKNSSGRRKPVVSYIDFSSAAYVYRCSGTQT